MNKGTITKRMLLVCHGHPFQTIGGVGQVIEQLVTHLPKQGWEVHALAPSSNTSLRQISITSTQQSWGTLHSLNRPIYRWSQSWRDEKTNDHLLRWVEQLHPTVIHIHHLNKLPWEWLLKGKESIAYHLWLTLHDYAIPCSRGQLLDRHLHLCDGPRPIRCKDCVQSWLTLDGWQRKGLKIIHRPDGSISERIDLAATLLSAMDHIDAPSLNMINHFKQLYPTIRIRHCQLPMATVEPMRSQEERTVNGHRFLFVGSIHPSKGVHILLRAFAMLQKSHPSVRLSIIGQDSASDVVHNYGQIWKDFAGNTCNVDWIGTLSHQDVLKQMSQHQTLVLPSVWRENSPIVVREALQRGLHVICGRGGSHELSSTILHVQPLSVSALMNKMKTVVHQTLPSKRTYPPPENTIFEWVQNSTQPHHPRQ